MNEGRTLWGEYMDLMDQRDHVLRFLNEADEMRGGWEATPEGRAASEVAGLMARTIRTLLTPAFPGEFTRTTNRTPPPTDVHTRASQA